MSTRASSSAPSLVLTGGNAPTSPAPAGRAVITALIVATQFPIIGGLVAITTTKSAAWNSLKSGFLKVTRIKKVSVELVFSDRRVESWLSS
jgi:hypothetical protein